MKLHIKNIGGLLGEHVFELREGINEVMAPNAAGKTTLIKTLLSLLNTKDPNIQPEDLLNIDSDEGYIKLIMDGEEYHRVFKRRDGKVDELSSKLIADDERFSWLLLDPFMGRLVSKVLAGEEDITDFIDLTFELSKLRKEIEELKYIEAELQVKRTELLEKSKDLARLLKERDEFARKLTEKEKEAQKIEIEKIRFKEEVEKSIKELSDKISVLNGRLKSYKKEFEESTERIKDLEVKISTMEELVDKFQRKYPDPKATIESIDKEIDDIRDTIRQHESRLADINKANPVLADATAYKLPYCPVCGRPVEKPEEFWKYRAGELGKAAKELLNSIQSLRKKETELLNKKGDIESVWTRMRNITGVELPSLKRKLMLEKNRKEKLHNGIRDIEAQIKVLKDRIKDLELKIPLEEREKIDKIREVTGEIKALKEYLEGIKRRIANLGDVGHELEAVEKRLAKIMSERNNKEKELYGLRRNVAIEFRNIANELIRSLNFTWFRTITLKESNGSYYIRIIRRFPTGREEKQSLKQLSTSERMSIALVAILTGYKLGIASGYPYEKRIILADEALLSFDPERFEKVVKELRKYGKYIVVTKLVESQKTVKISIVHR